MQKHSAPNKNWRKASSLFKHNKTIAENSNYVPRYIREIINEYVRTNDRVLRNNLMKILHKKHDLMFPILVYIVHQCCAKDKLKLCENILSVVKNNDDLRTKIVNSAYGKNGYTPLIRAAFSGSESMLKFLITCGADLQHRNCHNEKLLEALDAGMQTQLCAAKYDVVKILKKKTLSSQNYVTIQYENKTTACVLENSLILNEKFPNEAKIATKEKGRDIYIRDRFIHCRKFINTAKLGRPKPQSKKNKLIPRHIAARRIQAWWHLINMKKRNVVKTITVTEAFKQYESFRNANIFRNLIFRDSSDNDILTFIERIASFPHNIVEDILSTQTINHKTYKKSI